MLPPHLTPPDQGLYAAVDVHYPATGGARAALVAAHDPRFAEITEQRLHELAEALPYEPGNFYVRELPAILAVIADLDAPPTLVIVDGYADLDPHGRPGLGAHLHASLRVPVIGIAKTAFRAATHAVEVRRGAAVRPLYVTAAGLAISDAVALVTGMAGQYRLPDALRRVDALARGRDPQPDRHRSPATAADLRNVD